MVCQDQFLNIYFPIPRLVKICFKDTEEKGSREGEKGREGRSWDPS